MSIRTRFSVVLSLVLWTSQAWGAPDKEALREKFKEGLALYESGHFDEALAIWQPIYAELGESDGYRLAFNLGRAEDARGHVQDAAKWFATYLAAVDTRRARGEPIEAGILGQEITARDRLAALSRELVRVESNAKGAELAIDEEAPVPAPATRYLLPGKHSLRLTKRGALLTEDTRDFLRGETIVLREPLPPEPPPSNNVPLTSREPERPTLLERTPPYSAAVPLTALGLTVLGGALTTASYVHANSVFDSYGAAGPSARDALGESYKSARTTSYVSLAITLVLAASSAGLGAYYFLGASTKTGRPLAIRF